MSMLKKIHETNGTSVKPVRSEPAAKYYHNGDSVKITDKYIFMHNTWYSVAHLSSVHLERQVSNPSAALMGLILGFAIAIPVVLVINMATRFGSPALSILILVIGAIAGAIIAASRVKYLHSVHTQFSSGARDSVLSENEDYIRDLADQLIRAMSENQ
ncbi:MAG: hypothetical protein HZC41_21925 [Chloroflexi bacterium]|nr:hypothetical protein [Chloroflexota bacterium]